MKSYDSKTWKMFALFPIIALIIVSYQNCSQGFDSTGQVGAATGRSDTSTPNENDNGVSGGLGCSASTGIAKNFPCSIYFNQATDSIVLTAAQKNYSDHLINGLNARGGWGNSNIFQVDTSIDVLETSDQHSSFYSVDPDDGWTDADRFTQVPAPPLGSSAGFESSDGTACDGGDCHYLVLDKKNRRLYEFYRAEVSGKRLANAGYGGAVIWPFDKMWTESLRGDVCTSADAGGFSIGAMLFSAEELAAGAINHAVRFILPNTRIANRTYVRPATHTTGDNTGRWAPAPTDDLTGPPLTDSSLEPGLPYGTRLRLKASFNISNLNGPAQVVARALKKYGMILADGGEIALTAKADAHSSVKYSSLGFSPRSLSSLKVSDFEVVPPIQPKPFPTGLTFQPTLIGPMIKVKYLDCYLNN